MLVVIIILGVHILKAVEYISQDWRTLLSVDERKQYNADFIQEWSRRSCGLSCILMALKYYKINTPSIIEIQEYAVSINAFCDSGLIHNKAVEILNHYGLSSKRISATVDELVLSMSDDKLFIASVGHAFSGIKKQGHLVLVYATTIVDDQTMILINDPSPYGKQNYCISHDEFMSSYSGKGILIAR